MRFGDLFLFGFFEVVESLLLLSVLLNAFLFLLLLQGDLSLNFEKIFVSPGEFGTDGNHFLLAFDVFLSLAFKLLLDLLLDELTLEFVLLQFLDVVEFEVFELLSNHVRVLLLLVELFLELLSEALVVLGHLLLLELFPLQVDLLLKQLLPVSKGNLGLLFSQDIAHQHLGVQGLHFVLVVVEHLVGLIKLVLSLALGEPFFLGVNLSPGNLKKYNR